MPLWHAGALFASERLDFFAHPNGLLVFDQRFCLPRSSHPPDLRFNVRVDLHAPLAAEQWLRPIQNIGWETMDESTFHVTEGLQSWQLANHDPNAMAFLLLPGAQLQSHEILEHHHFAQADAEEADGVSRRYSMELRVEADAEAVLEAASGPQIKAMSCDGVWSMGQRQLCLMSPENQFQRGRFHFLGVTFDALMRDVMSIQKKDPIQRFALCHPSCGNRGSPGSPRAEAEELLMRLAGSTQVLRRIEWQMAGEAEPYWCSLLLLLLPFFVGDLSVQGLLCCLLSLLHLLMGLDIFCLPGPPTLLWRDLDALWGYARLTATAHAMLALSAAFASRPVRGATDALGRFLRKWLRLAPAGLALRLLSASASEFTHARPQGSGWPERRLFSFRAGAMQHFNLDFRRCGTAVECVEPWKGWPFGLKDVLWAFPDVADVGWFLERWGVPGEGVGRFLQRTLELGLCCASLDAWHVRDPRMPFDCQRLNFTLAPLVAWFTRSRAVCASAVPHQGVLLRLSLALGVRSEVEEVYNFYAKTEHDVVLCCLRRGKLPTKVFRQLKEAVKPSIECWPHPDSVALNDFGVPDKIMANGVVQRDHGGDLCWLRNEQVPKGKVSAGPYRRLGPDEVRSVVDSFLDKNPEMLNKVEKLMDATHSSARGPVPAFAAANAQDAVFPYMCLQRRWPPEPHLDVPVGQRLGLGIPWHVDGGPSICFMAVTLDARKRWFQGWAGLGKWTGDIKTKKFTFRPGDWYWSSPSCFWHRVGSICKKSNDTVSTTLLLRSAPEQSVKSRPDEQQNGVV
ncbi:unnamed protein product [Durusdinium trenchii]|uniref:Uncharacterized protein n=1 Tax=Durusdinium trenchii TaxID=1381693 RepID=A0ABP0P8I6_9DINO